MTMAGLHEDIVAVARVWTCVQVGMYQAKLMAGWLQQAQKDVVKMGQWRGRANGWLSRAEEC